ncbi:MAG: hypothetical protein LUQ50_15545, partial [Methanospirillum sp.]|uniref:hypothetical protein n=1 Tax=Methanospirillum sp. TaxID=45200 RepID=UPI002375DA4C
MKHIIVEMMLLMLLLGAVVTADEQMVPNETITNQSEGWTMTSSAALALEKTYAYDMFCIENTYQYLKTGNASYRDDMMNTMYDYDGTMGSWLSTLDNSTQTNQDATAIRKESFNTWTELNQTLIQILSSYDVNTTIDPTLLSQFETDSWNHVKSFDKLMKYVDENSFDQNRSQIPLYLDLMKGCIAVDAYAMTKNPDEKEFYSSAMKSFDDTIEMYEVRFPETSTEYLKNLKNDLKTGVEDQFAFIDTGTTN